MYVQARRLSCGDESEREGASEEGEKKEGESDHRRERRPAVRERVPFDRLVSLRLEIDLGPSFMLMRWLPVNCVDGPLLPLLGFFRFRKFEYYLWDGIVGQ